MRARWVSTLVWCLSLGATLGQAASDDATSHRSFADVEQWVSVFDDPARDAYQKPRQVVRALRIRPGMRVADLGAGTGYFSRFLSTAVGAAGTVLAVDTEPELVRHLRERAEKEQTDNVVPILASPDNPRLPRGAVDLVLLVDTFHHIDHRVAYFGRLRATLAPGGRVAVVDWQKRETPVGPQLGRPRRDARAGEEPRRRGEGGAGEWCRRGAGVGDERRSGRQQRLGKGDGSARRRGLGQGRRPALRRRLGEGGGSEDGRRLGEGE